MSKAIDDLLNRQAQDDVKAATRQKYALLLEDSFVRRERPFVDKVFDSIKRVAQHNNSHPLRRKMLAAPLLDTTGKLTIQTALTSPGDSAETLYVEYDATKRTINVNIEMVSHPGTFTPEYYVDSYLLQAMDSGMIAIRTNTNGLAKGYVTSAEEVADEIVTAFLAAEGWHL